MPHTDSSLMIAWLIPLFPLIGFLINGLFGARLPKNVSGGLATLAVFASFGVALDILMTKILPTDEHARQFTQYLAPWLTVPADPSGIKAFAVNFELLIDPLSILMMLIITGVGGLIHLYSTAYMAADKLYSRFFTYLNLFVFFMLLLVMGNNFPMLFIGWEGVGLCSYLLIGFFFEKKSAADAAKKAFIMNRIGDVGVLIGMFMIFHYFGTLDFLTGQSGVTGMLQAAPALVAQATPVLITTMLLMLFLGATGKSAQLPLYTWLPDAMEGPTPVSALIHAATMVTAGVYMVTRTHVLFELSDIALAVVAVIGITTALFAATIGLAQNDIKRVLAYSTVSQLGYMFAACGVGVFTAGMYHVMTHAFFKACLFLGSGSVIHAIEHGMRAKHAHGDEAHADGDGEHAGHSIDIDLQTHGTSGPDPLDPQDMRNMGGLFGKIKVTALTMLVATLAIAGVAPFAGFWSKDEILWHLWQGHNGTPNPNWLLWGVGASTALLTSFYMFRLIMKTFAGAPRTDAAAHAHESSPCITIPLMILAALSLLTGWVFLPYEKFVEFLAPSAVTPGYLPPLHHPEMEHTLGYGLMGVIVLVLLLCFGVYKNAKNAQLLSPEQRADRAPLSLGWAYNVLLNKYFVDELYNFVFVGPGKKLSDWLWKTFDVQLIDGLVNGVGAMTRWAGNVARRAQTGYVRNYAFSMVVGILVVLIGCIAGWGHHQ